LREGVRANQKDPRLARRLAMALSSRGDKKSAADVLANLRDADPVSAKWAK
jgi:hypothetical protein